MIGVAFSYVNRLRMNIDKIEEIEKLDSKNMLGSLELLSEQIKQIVMQSDTVRVPKTYAKCANIIVLGMGGSTLGSHIIKSIFEAELDVPFEIVNGYQLPQFADKSSLVLVSSYSGTTEEPLQAMLEAKKRGCKLMIITSGGELAKRAKKQKIPALLFTTENNPCGSPRMGLGYSVVGQMILLALAGFIDLSDAILLQILNTITQADHLFGVDSKTIKNPAKQIAGKLSARSVWYVASSHLAGSVHTAANQLNENAKHFGGSFLIPELNHHLIEGLQYPKSNSENLAFVLIESKLYDKKVQKRFEVTKEVLKKNKILFTSYTCLSKTKLLQAMECLVLSSYISFYLAMVEGIDPTAIPFVDFLKKALKK